MMDEKKQVMFQQYMSRVARAAKRHCMEGGMYSGEEGCLRFAREVGYALLDFSRLKSDLFDMMSRTYSSICVIAYNLKPPIDAKKWNNEMALAIQRRTI